MKKKITALVLVVAVLAMLFTGMTLAYFTDTDSAVNVFTVGDVDIELDETVGVTDSNGNDAPDRVVEAETGAIFTGILPGNKMEKEVTVTNLENPAYVRVTVIVNNYDLIDAVGNYYEAKGYTEEQIQAVYDEIFNGWGLIFSHGDPRDMRMTDDQKVVASDKTELLRVDSTFTTKATDGSFHFSINNMFKTEHEENQPSYMGGNGVYFAGGYYAQHLNDYELCYTYYFAMEKGGSATLFNGLTCPAEFNQELAAMFDGLEIEIYAAAIQKEGFADAKTAFEQLNSEFPISTMRASVNPPVIVDSAEELTEALNEGGYIEVAADIDTTEGVTVPDTTDAEIDLNGNAVNTYVINNGDVTIANGAINVDFTGFQNHGTAVIENVTMTAGNNANYSNIGQAGSETVYNNVEIVSAGGGIGIVNGAKVTFNSGSVAVNSTSTSGRYVFYVAGAGSELTINDGEFSFAKEYNQQRAYIYAEAGTTVYVNGGNFGPASARNGYTGGFMGEGTIIITGGTFGFDPTTWVAEGYQAVKDGTVWTVSPVNP